MYVRVAMKTHLTHIPRGSTVLVDRGYYSSEQSITKHVCAHVNVMYPLFFVFSDNHIHQLAATD